MCCYCRMSGVITYSNCTWKEKLHDCGVSSKLPFSSLVRKPAWLPVSHLIVVNPRFFLDIKKERTRRGWEKKSQGCVYEEWLREESP